MAELQNKASPNPDGTAPEGSPVDMQSIQSLLRGFALVVSNINFYGQKHNVTRKSVENAYQLLMKFFERFERVNLSLAEGTLVADGQPVEIKNPLLDGLAKQLAAIEVGGFSLVRGMTWEEFWKLMMLISTHPDKVKEMGSFSDAVTQMGLEDVQAKRVVYQRVTEEEVVVKKDDLSEAVAAAEAGGGRDMLSSLMAYLKGESDAPPEEIAQGLNQLSADVGKLAEVIVNTAKTLQEQSADGGKRLGEIVAECLRKTYDGLLQDPAARTQQGKKAMAKMLAELEEQVEAKLKETPETAAEADAAIIKETLEEMTTELAVDSLASEYMKKRKGIETAETKILKFLKKSGLDEHGITEELKQKLLESGLTPDGWQELLTKSVTAAASATRRARESGGDEAKVLNDMLAHVGELLDPSRLGPDGQLPAEELAKTVEQVSQQVLTVTAGTEQKMAALEQKIVEFMQPPPAGLSAAARARRDAEARKALFAMLAEIVQELCQPLSVVSSTVDMLRGGYLGAVTQTQVEMLALASSSAERIKHLVDKLTEIAGFPAGTKPDAGILKTVYEN